MSNKNLRGSSDIQATNPNIHLHMLYSCRKYNQNLSEVW